MEIPAYLRVLWRYRLAVVASALLAALVATAVHFTIRDGALEIRAEREYSAATTVLLGGGQRSPFLSESPARERVPGMSAAQEEDLSSTAVVYAYLVSGEAVRSEVVARQGPLGEREGVGGVRRTTQPSGSERNPGRASLPILSIIGTSPDPARAVELSRAATSVFLEQALARQNADGIPEERRVTFTVTDEGAPEPGPLGTVALPIAATGVAVFLLGVLAILAVHGLRLRRAAASPAPLGSTAAVDDAAIEPRRERTSAR